MHSFEVSATPCMISVRLYLWEVDSALLSLPLLLALKDRHIITMIVQVGLGGQLSCSTCLAVIVRTLL